MSEGEAAIRDRNAVASFARVMAEKLDYSRREKGRGGWPHVSTGVLWRMLREHVEKGDPVDVALFAMMIFHNSRKAP